MTATMAVGAAEENGITAMIDVSDRLGLVIKMAIVIGATEGVDHLLGATDILGGRMAEAGVGAEAVPPLRGIAGATVAEAARRRHETGAVGAATAVRPCVVASEVAADHRCVVVSAVAAVHRDANAANVPAAARHTVGTCVTTVGDLAGAQEALCGPAKLATMGRVSGHRCDGRDKKLAVNIILILVSAMHHA